MDDIVLKIMKAFLCCFFLCTHELYSLDMVNSMKPSSVCVEQNIDRIGYMHAITVCILAAEYAPKKYWKKWPLKR